MRTLSTIVLMFHIGCHEISPVFAAAPRELQEGDRISLRVGIVGGKVAPRVRKKVDIISNANGVALSITRDGKTKNGSMSKEEFGSLAQALAPIWELPLEDPTNSEDIYEMDTGLEVEMAGKRWANGAPGGCIHLHSQVQPTNRQKSVFKKMVTQIEQAAEKHIQRSMRSTSSMTLWPRIK